MKETSVTKAFLSLVMSASWLAGVAVAQGWIKLVAILLPPYAWYIFIEKLMQFYKII